ncbi:MAG TPA: polyprenyl synthetase family protein [Candidatus Baltobacteraceae bacterium]|nr:polyprenyl synthetase family protein [Candidatus Baltobacteraceae bacterium]
MRPLFAARSAALDGTLEPLLLTRHRARISAWMRERRLPDAWLSGKMVSYHMGWTDASGNEVRVRTGKLVRPSLCLWACQAMGGEIEWALPAAAAIESFHNFTLIHDDIQDEDGRRHHRATVWSLWGVPQAINAGDALQTLAFSAMAEHARHPRRMLRAISALAQAGLVVIEGQCLDLELEGTQCGGLRDYVRMAAAKTGALLGASLETGVLLAGADAATAARFRRAGRLLGTAFQIRDDWLGAYGDPALTGKSAQADARRRKMTFPAIAATRLKSQQVRRKVSDVTRSAALRYAEMAVFALSRTAIEKSALDEFEEVAYYVATRSQ